MASLPQFQFTTPMNPMTSTQASEWRVEQSTRPVRRTDASSYFRSSKSESFPTVRPSQYTLVLTNIDILGNPFSLAPGNIRRL